MRHLMFKERFFPEYGVVIVPQERDPWSALQPVSTIAVPAENLLDMPSWHRVLLG